MTPAVTIGPYRLALEPRGLRIEQVAGEFRAESHAILRLTLDIEGGASSAVAIETLFAQGAGAGFRAAVKNVVVQGFIEDAPDAGGLSVSLTIRAGEASKVRVGCNLLLEGQADPRWMIPGLFYGNNAPSRGNSRVYPVYSELSRDNRRMISNYWAFRADRAATPMVCAWSFAIFAFIATSEQVRSADEISVGMSGLRFSSEDGQPVIGVDLPYCEAPAKFSFCHDDRTDAEATFMELLPDGAVEVELLLGLGEPDLHGYARAMRAIDARNAEAHPVGDVPPADLVEHTAHVGLLRWHYDSRHAAIFETAAFDRHFGKKGAYTERTHMHAGWLSGALPAFTLLWAGRETDHADSIAAGTAVLNKFTDTLAPCGTIFPVWTQENGWSCSFGPDDGTAHSRTVAEAVLFILKAIALELRHNKQHPEWSEAAISSLKYAMGAQREDGAFPSYYDLSTGRPMGFDGCAGMAWIAPMAVAANLLGQDFFRDVALRAANHYATYIQKGLLHGSIEDQPAVPSSDDCHMAMIGYLALYEVERDVRWLDLARKAADLALTWRFTYNVAFAPATILGSYDVRTRGGDISSVACPTLGCGGLIAYREFVKLATYTGDDYYRMRAEDSRQFAAQLLVMEDGQFNGREGMAAGQIFHTDWWQPKGVMQSVSHAMAAALIKYSGLVYRHMDEARQPVEPADDAPTPEKVMYAEVVFEEPSGEGEALGSGLLSALGISDTKATQRADSQPISSLPLRERGSRGLSSENVPMPSFGANEPIPYPDQELKEAAAPEVNNDDTTPLKYKIF